MGVAANGHCLPTLDAAAAYACGSVYPVAAVGIDSTGAAISGLIECTGTSGATMTLHRYKNGGAPTVLSMTYAGPSCDELEWLGYSPFGLSATDGGLMAAAIAGVWLAAWGWKAVARTLNAGDHE
jgi:hypothetical protein